ncbi:MAG TPA: hypothetical protein VJM08_11690, partial [Anaerolineales bacterium]|nr:hypothetical protein [Anaerolineales bacterium]
MTTLTPPNPESHFDRDSWLVAAAAASYVAIALILMLISFRFPSDGWQYDDFSDDLLALRNISGNASPLQQGDIVVAVDGQAMQRLKLRPAATSDAWRTGGTARYTVIRDDQTLELDVMLKPQPLTYWWRFVTSEESLIRNIVNFASLALASFVFIRRPRNLGARALLLAFAMWLGMDGFFLACNAVAVHFFPPTYYYLFLLFSLSWIWWLLPSLITFVLVYPLRKGPMRHYARQTLTLLFGLPAAISLAALPLGVEQIYLVTLAVLVVLFLVSTLVSTIHTLWTDHDPIVRAQLGWMILGLVLTAVLPLVWFQLSASFPNSPLITILQEVGPVVQIAFPLCTAIAILRYRLFDINLIINRALVYGTLTLLVIGLYIFVVGYVGTLFSMENNLGISLLATGLVAVLFQPLRDRLQLGVNRLMYGRRDEPVAVLSQLGERLEATILPEEILPGLAETIVQALKL